MWGGVASDAEACRELEKDKFELRKHALGGWVALQVAHLGAAPVTCADCPTAPI